MAADVIAYEKRSRNGDAGEYFVAFTVNRTFGWPCRLLDVDIGIDAELEIMDGNSASTGDIIKIQIKSFESLPETGTVSVYVEDRHIGYWKRVCLPVVICAVDLTRRKVYWKQITATEAYDSGGVSKKVSFCTIHDVLDKDSEDRLRKLVSPPESKQLDALFVGLRLLVEKLPGPNTSFLDYVAIDRAKAACNETEAVVRKIETLIAHFPWRVSLKGLRELEYVRARIRGVRQQADFDSVNLTES